MTDVEQALFRMERAVRWTWALLVAWAVGLGTPGKGALLLQAILDDIEDVRIRRMLREARARTEHEAWMNRARAAAKARKSALS